MLKVTVWYRGEHGDDVVPLGYEDIETVRNEKGIVVLEAASFIIWYPLSQVVCVRMERVE